MKRRLLLGYIGILNACGSEPVHSMHDASLSEEECADCESARSSDSGFRGSDASTDQAAHSFGVPIITVSPAILDFGMPALDETTNRFLTIGNSGDELLTVSRVAADEAVGSDGISLAPVSDEWEILPSESVVITISLRPAERRDHYGLIVISSNDPQASIVRIPMVGEP